MTPTYYHRQYHRPPWGGDSFVATVVGKLIIANVAAFVLQLLFRPHFDHIFALQPQAVVQNFYIWQLASYMFLHGGVVHLLFNMIVLFFFGSTLEMAWGSKRLLQYYLTCGVGAGLLEDYRELVLWNRVGLLEVDLDPSVRGLDVAAGALVL